MTMEVILSTAFGRSVDVQGGQGGEIYEAACGVFAAVSGKKSAVIGIIFFLLSTRQRMHPFQCLMCLILVLL